MYSLTTGFCHHVQFINGADTVGNHLETDLHVMQEENGEKDGLQASQTG